MSYKIIVDSCGELTEEMKASRHFETASLQIEVAGQRIVDDETFDQAEFLKLVAASPSARNHPVRHRKDIWKGTAVKKRESMRLPYQQNSAVLITARAGEGISTGRIREKDIYVFNSRSASVGETLIAMKIRSARKKE